MDTQHWHAAECDVVVNPPSLHSAAVPVAAYLGNHVIKHQLWMCNDWQIQTLLIDSTHTQQEGL